MGRSVVLLAALCLAACAQQDVQVPDARRMVMAGRSPTENLRNGCVADHQAGVDYFPQKSRFTDSAQLKVSYHGNWKRVTFTPAVDTRETLSLVLVQCGTPHPQLGPRDVLIEVPVRNFATANASMLGAAVLLGVDDRLRGVPSTMSVSLPSIRRRIEAGDIIPIYAASHGNGEQGAALNADLFFTFYSAYPEANLHPLLRRMGVTSAPQSDHTEPTPLGRAEWIKYLGLFFNLEAEANTLFEDRARRYRALATQVRAVRHRPLVQLGYPDGRDDWVQAGGRNQLYRLVEDAGGRHAWADVANAGSLTFAPMERLYDRAGAADIWIGNFIPGAPDLTDLRREHPRLSWIAPIAHGRVWWLDAGKEGVRNPWSDQSMTEPQDSLADLIQILHPERADPARRPRFTRPVEEQGS